MKSKAFLTFITLTILLSVTTANAQFSCMRAPDPIVIQGSLNIGDVQQAGRVTRDGKPSTCAGDTGALENGTAVRRDAHNFTNPYNETVCVRVEQDFSGCAGNQTQSIAYSNYNPAAPAANVIGDAGYSTINKGSYSFSVGPSANFTIVVNEIDANAGCPLYKLKVTYLRNCRQPGFDLTNDGKADPTVYRTSSISKWYTHDSETGNMFVQNFGTVGDVVTGGNDYTGDGRSDVSVYRAGNNTWYRANSQFTPESDFTATPWGATGDRPVPGDYDGDGLSDVAVWRPSEGNFYIFRSSDNSLQSMHWGINGDRMVSGDFDGDTLTDIAVVRPTSGGLQWWLLKSNYNYGFDQLVNWGLSAGDILVPADYDGDTITDIAIWRESEGNFYVRRSSDLTMQVFKWGTTGDKAQPADYDGDKVADFAVFRPATSTWYIYNSGTQTARYLNWGTSGDIAITTPYRIQ
ncbi:MAG TPA: VCBS repeat-containing protein [Pyrinomonadaceae bacterium]|nr:VCBS repeat-containing protein [Pyrinomonadaceae bacterium]